MKSDKVFLSHILAEANFLTARTQALSLSKFAADDVLTSGRGELGFSKLYAELPPARMFGDTARVTASWLEFPFLDLELTGLTQVDVSARPAPAATPAPAAVPGGELRGQMHYKYMPRTGEWGKADASYAVITWRRCWPRAKGRCWPAVSPMRRRA